MEKLNQKALPLKLTMTEAWDRMPWMIAKILTDPKATTRHIRTGIRDRKDEGNRGRGND